MADVTQDQVVDYIKGISVLELSQLVKKLEEELGVTAAAALPVAVAGAAALGPTPGRSIMARFGTSIVVVAGMAVTSRLSTPARTSSIAS